MNALSSNAISPASIDRTSAAELATLYALLTAAAAESVPGEFSGLRNREDQIALGTEFTDADQLGTLARTEAGFSAD
jgi:hypothetical protein